MKINWFGRTYYGDKKQYKRPVRYALRMFLEHDVYDKIVHRHYHRDEKGNWSIKKYRWNCKESHWIFASGKIDKK